MFCVTESLSLPGLHLGDRSAPDAPAGLLLGWQELMGWLECTLHSVPSPCSFLPGGNEGKEGARVNTETTRYINKTVRGLGEV